MFAFNHNSSAGWCAAVLSTTVQDKPLVYRQSISLTGWIGQKMLKVTVIFSLNVKWNKWSAQTSLKTELKPVPIYKKIRQIYYVTPLKKKENNSQLDPNRIHQ